MMINLFYCKHKMSNTSTCAHLATHKVTYVSKKNPDIIISNNAHRCYLHKLKATANKKAIRAEPFDQSENIANVNAYLTSLIGKKIKSSAHTARELTVVFLKGNGGIMCYQSHSKKWKFVYYNQIEFVY